MAIGNSGCWDFPTDVLVEILLRLPPSSQRRFRLVCRLWRDLINECTTEMQSRGKALLWDPEHSIAYVVDDLSPSSTSSLRVLWKPSSTKEKGVQLVGTCNGLLCLCERLGGALTLVNPATGEALSIPPCTGLFSETSSWKNWSDDNEAYNFTYHPTSGLYKVVRIPSILDAAFEPEAVHVLTLGEASWRKVPANGLIKGSIRCRFQAGIVSVDGTTYWVTDGGDDDAARVVSLDLEHERITSARQLPLPDWPHRAEHYHLTEVHGSLGVAIRDYDFLGKGTTHVWVLDKGGRWSHRYKFSQRSFPQPHFLYGRYALTLKYSSIHSHYTRKIESSSDAMVCVGHRDEGTPIAKMERLYFWRRKQTFVHVETTEPLAVYKAMSN